MFVRRSLCTHALAIASIVPVLLGCAVAGLNAQQPRVRECGVARDSAASDARHAIACAEEFVRRNGYTEAPPTTDSTLVAFESIEFADSLREVLALRHNALMERAVGVCIGKADGDGLTDHAYTVIFYLRATSGGHARRVTMSAQFDELWVQRGVFLFTPVERRLGCRPVAEVDVAPG
ncbi:MAG TPA: hypothetical protein VEW03_05480 [Longimicrobiaceae bacterium]|nr:hypothetical protein [Longimicrobiaceae bacterium]